MRNALNMNRERIATCQLTLSQGYEVPLLRPRVENAPPPSCISVANAPPPSCIPVENAQPPSCIPEENTPPPSCIRTQCWSRGKRYKKSGRHYSCMGRLSRVGQCEMLAWIKNRMRNALNMHRERIATCQLTLSPGYDVPLLCPRSRECSTAILYNSRECSTAILYTRRECSTAIVYTYPVLEPGDAL